MSTLVYTLADAGRGGPAVNLMTGLARLARDPRGGLADLRPMIVDCGLSDAQRARAADAGVECLRFEPAEAWAWPDPQSRYMWARYLCLPELPDAAAYWCLDSDVILDRLAARVWTDRSDGRWPGLAVAQQPQTWFSLLRGHGIDADQGLGDALYEPIRSSGVWCVDATCRAWLADGMARELALARREGWAHWAEECAFNRLLRGGGPRARCHGPAWHWQAGYGFHVLDPLGRRVTDGPRGRLYTPGGEPIRLLHFGGAGNADQLDHVEPGAYLPWPYLERDGRWWGAGG